MVKLPAGRTTISGQARQSRKTVPAARGASFACATAVKLQASARMMLSFFISVHSEIIFAHLSILHDKPDMLEFGYVGYGVAAYRNQISDGANLVLPAKHLGGVDRNGTNHTKCRHSGGADSAAR